MKMEEYTYTNLMKIHEQFVDDYYFPQNYSYLMPTFGEHMMHCLLNNETRNKMFNILLNKMIYVSQYYTPDIKTEFDSIIKNIKTTQKYKTNPLEFFYQCLTGFFARTKQQEIANNIINDVCQNTIVEQTGGYKVFSQFIDENSDIKFSKKNDKKGRIHTLIMGGGKTKMITPLVIIKYLQQMSLYQLKLKLNKDNTTNNSGNHMYIVLPENLVNQSYEHLVMLNMYFPIIVQKIEESRDSESIFSQSVNSSNDLELKVFVMSDTTMKCGILNDKNFTIKKNVEKHCYLFDEVDTILDPIISELNYPDVKTETNLKSIDKFYDIVYDVLYDIFVKNTNEITQMLKEHENEYLTTPHFYLKTHGDLSNKLKTYAKTKIVDSFRLNEKIKRGLENPENVDETYLKSLSDEDIQILMGLHNFISEALLSSLTLRNRHHYGLSETFPKNQKDILPIIVPFSYAEKPRDDSSFSNPILVMTLTTIDYIVQNKPKPLPNSIINNMIIIINDILKEYPPEYIQYTDIYKEYKSLGLSIPVENIKNITNLSENDIDKLRHSKLFIKIICKHNCQKYIKFSTSQENISGLDLVMSNNTVYRSGFTGTPNIPKFVDMYKDKELTIINEQTNTFEESTTTKINKTILASRAVFAEPNDNIVNYITNVLKQLNDHNVLIDCGAVLVGTTPDMIFNIVNKLKPNLQQFIYWNNKDYPITKNKDGKELLWTGSMTPNMFYYYDNMHTTGIDAQIDVNAKGIVLLGSTSRYRDVAQSMYRMRKLEVGQSITFVVNNKIKNNIDMNEFLDWFNSDEKSYLNSQQLLMNNQNILALSRYTNSPNYLLENAFSYPSTQTLTNLNVVTGNESLRHNHIINTKNDLMNKLSKESENVNINVTEINEINVNKSMNSNSISMAMQQEIEQVKELTQNQSHEKRQNKTLVIIQGQQYLISNNTIEDYYNISNHEYYEPLMKNHVYISKNLQYYLSPYMITSHNNILFILPFVEGYKLFNTYTENKILFPDDVTFIDSNGVQFGGTDNLLHITLSVFISKFIDKTLYTSLSDYLNMFKLIKQQNTIAMNLLHLMTNENSTNNIFAMFSKAINIYNSNVNLHNETINNFNGSNIDERKNIFKSAEEDTKTLLSFFTLNGNILNKTIDF